MTIELFCLLALALWSIPLNYFPTLGRFLVGGIEWGLSNRDTLPDTAPWVARADRAQRNHWENFPMIAVVILLLFITDQSNGLTEKLAIALLAFRVLHAAFYIIGIPLLRSFAFVGALLALFGLVWQLLV
ncbi:MAG: MAPEG family protein [Leptolyngbyaceae cyanobacterium]